MKRSDLKPKNSFSLHWPWLLLFPAIVVGLHWDVVCHLKSTVLSGSQVGGYFAWEYWWFSKIFSANAPANPFFTDFLMFPVGVPLFIQAPITTFLGVALTAFIGPYAATNVLALVAYIGSGIAMYALAYRITKSPMASFLAGYIFMFNHYSLTQHVLGHMGESFLFFVPILFLGLVLLSDVLDLTSMAVFTIGAVGVCLTTAYIAFSCLLVGLPVVVLVLALHIPMNDKKGFFVRIGLGLLIAGALGLIVYLPVILMRHILIGGGDVSSLSVFSFLDFPAWHPADFIQKARQMTSSLPGPHSITDSYLGRNEFVGKAKPEELMGFFGLSTLALIAHGIYHRLYAKHRVWLWLAGVGLVLSLGAWLQIRYVETRFPMPYLIIKQLPLLDMFRTPSRLIVLSWLSIGVLVSISFVHLNASFRKPVYKWLMLLLFVSFYSWEMGLSQLGKISTPLNVGEAYKTIGTDPLNNAVLELPVAVDKKGEVTINAQIYMLKQPIHGKPLVVGRPSRHTLNSLSFLEKTDFVYELTHPHTLVALYSNPQYKERLAMIKKDGKNILQRSGIQFVTLHTEDHFFSEDVIKRYEQFLEDILGKPVLEDEFGVILYRI